MTRHFLRDDVLDGPQSVVWLLASSSGEAT